MTGRGFALLVAGALGAVFLLSLTLVTGFAILYALTEGDPGALGVYAPILLGCLVLWWLLWFLWRRRRSDEGVDGH